MSIILKNKNLYNNNSEDSIDYGNPLSQGLIFACTFNQGNGRKLVDLVTKNVSVPTNYLSYTPYKYGKSAKFNGSSDVYFRRLNKYSVPDGKLTVSFLYTPDSTFGTKYLITNTSSGTAAGWSIMHGNGGQPSIAVGDGVNGEWNENASTSMIEGSKRYYHWTVTVDNSRQEVNWYLDGKIDAAAVFLVRLLANNTNTDLYIGSNKGSTFAEGRLGFVYFWNRKLTTQEIFYLNEDKFSFIKRNKRKIIHLINSSGGGQSSTANPSTANISISVNTSVASFASSQIASPSLSTVTIQVNTSTATASQSAVAQPTLISQTVLVNAPTASYSQSSIAQPSLAIVTVQVNTSTASSSTSQSANASPALVGVTVLVNQASASSTTSQSATATPSLASITILVNTPSATFTRSVEALPGTNIITLTVPTATASFVSSRIAQPSLALITVVVNTPSAGQITSSNITVRILMKSKMTKTVSSNSRIDKFINMQSEIL